MDIPTNRYIEAHNRVIEVMDSVRMCVLDDITERINDGEGWTQNMRDRALDYARIYALRDVMTIMDCGFALENALAMWKKEPGTLGLEGACIDAVEEAWEDFNDDENWDEEED